MFGTRRRLSLSDSIIHICKFSSSITPGKAASEVLLIHGCVKMLTSKVVIDPQEYAENQWTSINMANSEFFQALSKISRCWLTAIRNTSATCNAVFCELWNCYNQLKSRSCLKCSLCPDEKKLSAVPAEVYNSILKYLQPFWAAFFSIWSQKSISQRLLTL